MSVDVIFLLIVIFAGATVQVGVGIGFSLIVAPLMMILLGTATAVPLLLALNTLVSVLAVDWKLWRLEKTIINKAISGCLVGILLGSILYPFFSERLVLGVTATLLLFSVVVSFFNNLPNADPVRFNVVSVVSGLATVWAATPGPIIVFGFTLSGYSPQQTRKLVQPVALVAYGVAFLLHSLLDWSVVASSANLGLFAIAAFMGSLLGRVVGPMLPQTIIKNAIGFISIVACAVLFYRAYLLS